VAQSLHIISSGTTTISGTIQNGTGGLIKNGPGTLVLTGANTYTGATVLNAGVTLANNTSGNALTATTVNSGAILGGTGSLAGLIVNTGGIVAPGNNGPGSLVVNANAAFNPGSSLVVEMNDPTAGTGYDQLIVNGTVDLGNANLLLTLGFNPTASDFFYLVNNDDTDAVTGIFAGLAQGSNVFTNFGGNSYTALISYTGEFNTTSFVGGGNDVVLYNFAATAVPEPGSLAALAALTGFGLIRKYRRRKASSALA
jgi:fibronectin-binding autotransporter adhesin